MKPAEQERRKEKQWDMLTVPMPDQTENGSPYVSLIAYGTLQHRSPQRQCPAFGYTGDHIRSARNLEDLDMTNAAHRAGARRDILEAYKGAELHQRFCFQDAREFDDLGTQEFRTHKGTHPEIMKGLAKKLTPEGMLPFIDNLCSWVETNDCCVCNLFDVSVCTGGRHRSYAPKTMKFNYINKNALNLLGIEVGIKNYPLLSDGGRMCEHDCPICTHTDPDAKRAAEEAQAKFDSVCDEARRIRADMKARGTWTRTKDNDTVLEIGDRMMVPPAPNVKPSVGFENVEAPYQFTLIRLHERRDINSPNI